MGRFAMGAGWPIGAFGWSAGMGDAGRLAGSVLMPEAGGPLDPLSMSQRLSGERSETGEQRANKPSVI